MATIPNHSDIPPVKLNRLARKHGINHAASYLGGIDFQQAMNFLTYKYQVMANLKFDTGKQKKQTKILLQKAERLIKAIDEFDEALNGFANLSENPVKKNMTLYREVDVQLEQVRLNTELWAKAASRSFDEFEAEGKIKMNVGDPAYKFLLRDLIQIYEEGTGKKASRSFNARTGQYTGPMIRFIDECFDLLGAVKKTNKALGLAIDRLMNERKSLE